MSLPDRQQLGVWVPADIYDELKRLAATEDLSLAQLVRRLLRDHVEMTGVGDYPDCCDACDDDAIYQPFKMRSDGKGYYHCAKGHRWTCWWSIERPLAVAE